MAEDKEEKAPDQPRDDNITDKSLKAVDLLYEAMLFWRDEGAKLIQDLKHKLNSDGEGKLAAKVALVWKNVDDRWIDIAAKLAPYQSAKLSSIEHKGGTVVRYIVEAPRRSKDNKEWLEQVEVDRLSLPKPIVISQTNNSFDQTIDDAEYEEINGQEVH